MTAVQESNLTEQRNLLCAKLTAWGELRYLYIPGLLQLASDCNLELSPLENQGKPEEYRLWLPLSLPANRRRAVCHEGLPEIELKLRDAQLHDSLEGLHQTLRVKMRMRQFQQANIRGQRAGIKSAAMVEQVHERAKLYTEKYRVARVARYKLGGRGDWEEKFCELRNEDIRSYSNPDRIKRGPGRQGTDEEGQGPVVGGQVKMGDVNLYPEQRSRRDGTGQTRSALSWIWRTAPINTIDSPDANNDILRSEWCRSRARMKRFTEEVHRIREEMRRTLQYLQWRKNWWLERRERRSDIDGTMLEGLQAYASEQADLQERLANSFCALWNQPLGEPALIPSWTMETCAGDGDKEAEDDDEDETDVDELEGEDLRDDSEDE